MDGGLMIETLAFGGSGGARLSNILRYNPIFNSVTDRDAMNLQNKVIIWEGLHEFLLLMMIIFQMRIFSFQDFENDLYLELKRMKAIRKKNPYIRYYPRKLKHPEQAIMYVRIVQ